MKISYAILTHNEGEDINRLLSFLIANKRPTDEIVVLDDNSDDELTLKYLNEYKPHIKLFTIKVGLGYGNAAQKNFANSLCTGDYILQLDADELVTSKFVKLMPLILEKYPQIDACIIPRINIIEGLTQEWIDKWKWNANGTPRKWNINEKGWINFPDWQIRLYRNCDWVKWEHYPDSLHSKVVGAGVFSDEPKRWRAFPKDEDFSIIHVRKLDKCKFKIELYDRLEKTKIQMQIPKIELIDPR